MFGWFNKQAHTLVIEGEATVQMQPGETVLNGALRQGLDFPFSCKVGGCGTCKCQLLSGKVKELTDKTYLLSKEEIRDNFILGCQSIPRSDVVIRLPVDPLSQQEARGVVTRQVELTHDIVEVFITLDTPLRYRPGQYALVQAQGLDVPARCYSFAHAAADSGSQEVSFFVRRLPHGRLSRWLSSSAALQQPVKLNASLGNFYLRDSTRPLLCMAGGSGLAPLIALLEGAMSSGSSERDVCLMMGARRQRDLYYLEEIVRLQSQWQGKFTFIPVLSDEPADSGWPGRRGLVTDYLDASLTTDAEGYLCGPPPMIDAAIARMTALGVASNHIYFDKFLDQSDVAATQTIAQTLATTET